MSSGLHASLALRGPSFKPSCLHSLLANQKKGSNGKRQTVVVTPCNPKEDVHLQKRHMPVCQRWHARWDLIVVWVELFFTNNLLCKSWMWTLCYCVEHAWEQSEKKVCYLNQKSVILNSVNKTVSRALTLVGPTVTRQVLDPLAVLYIDNRLYIFFYHKKPVKVFRFRYLPIEAYTCNGMTGQLPLAPKLLSSVWDWIRDFFLR